MDILSKEEKLANMIYSQVISNLHNSDAIKASKIKKEQPGIPSMPLTAL